jgi:hypothetical protein
MKRQLGDLNNPLRRPVESAAMNGHSHATKFGRSGTVVPLRQSLSIGSRAGAAWLHAEFDRLAAVLLAEADFTSRLVVDAGIPG